MQSRSCVITHVCTQFKSKMLNEQIKAYYWYKNKIHEKVFQRVVTHLSVKAPGGTAFHAVVLKAPMTQKWLWRRASYQSTSLQMTGSSNCESAEPELNSLLSVFPNHSCMITLSLENLTDTCHQHPAAFLTHTCKSHTHEQREKLYKLKSDVR